MVKDYFKELLLQNLKIFLKNSDRYKLPVLEHDWAGFSIEILSDVDGVLNLPPYLPNYWFQYLFEKEKFSRHEKKILEYEKRIDSSEDGKPFFGIAKILYRAGLTYDEYMEACEFAGKEVEIVPYAHEAISILEKIPPFIGIGLNSASFINSLKFFCEYKKLPISYIDGSWLEFKNKKFTGRYFFNYGINKLKTGLKRLKEINCHPNLKVNVGKRNIITISDSILSDKHFRKFTLLGGMSIWVDKDSQKRIEYFPEETQEIIEINMPEILSDMRIFSNLLKLFYRTRIISLKTNPKQLIDASKITKELISLGKDCLTINDEKIFDRKLKEFRNLSHKTLNLLSNFDFPRHSTGIDFKYLDLLTENEMKKKKEILSQILEIYETNFPEALIA